MMNISILMGLASSTERENSLNDGEDEDLDVSAVK